MKTKVVFEFRCHVRKHLNVRARAKEFFAAAGNHDHLHAFIHAGRKNPRVELLHHLVGVSVRRRIVQRYNRDPFRDAIFN